MRLTFLRSIAAGDSVGGIVTRCSNMCPGRALTYNCFMFMPADDLPLHLFRRDVVLPGYQLASENAY